MRVALVVAGIVPLALADLPRQLCSRCILTDSCWQATPSTALAP